MAAFTVQLSASEVTAANISAIAAAIAPSGRNGTTIELPSGDYDLTGTTISADSSTNLSIRGQGSTYGGTRLFTTSAAGALLSAQQSRGLRIEGIALYAANGAFTSPLLDLGTPSSVPGGALFRIRDCNFTCVANGAIANNMIDLNNAIGGLIEGCYFIGGGQAIHGAHSASNYANTHLIIGNYFQQQSTAAVSDLTTACAVLGNTFEPLFSGAGAAYLTDATISQVSFSFTSNYCADTTAQSNWIVVQGEGIKIDGNLIWGSNNSVGVATAGNCNGLQVTGNDMRGLATALKTDTGSHTQVLYLGNCEHTVTTSVSTLATLGAGSLVCQGGALNAKGGWTTF